MRTIHLLLQTVFLLGFIHPAALAQEGHIRSQSIPLAKGWNAVFLEVDPQNPDLSNLFSGKPVDIVAAYQIRKAVSGEFMVDPDVDLFKRSGWNVWYADDRPDAFLTNLRAMFGGETYLIHATKAFTWNLQGTVVPTPVQWKPDAFNLVGFNVDSLTAPTFQQFFAPSEVHHPLRVYRLTDNAWRLVTQPSTERLKPGESFWVFSKGGSRYEGPLKVRTEFSSGLLLGVATTDDLILENHADHPIGVTIEHVTNGTAPVPLALLVTGIGKETIKTVSVPKPTGSWTQELAPLEAGQSIAVTFEAQVEAMTSPVHTSLLKVSTDMGTEWWIPVNASRRDLQN